MPPLRPITIKPGPPGWILVELPYSPERVQKIKTIVGRKWQENLHCWAIPRTGRTIIRLRALFSDDQITVAPELRAPTTKPVGWQPTIKVAPGPSHDLLRTFKDILQQKAYSPHTVKIYTFHTRRFLKTLKKSPTDLQPEDIQTYLYHLKTQDLAAETYLSQAIRALKSLCQLALHKPPEFLQLAFPPRKKTTL